MEEIKMTPAGKQAMDEFLRVLDGVLQRLSGNSEGLDVKNVVAEVKSQVREQLRAESGEPEET